MKFSFSSVFLSLALALSSASAFAGSGDNAGPVCKDDSVATCRDGNPATCPPCPTAPPAAAPPTTDTAKPKSPASPKAPAPTTPPIAVPPGSTIYVYNYAAGGAGGSVTPAPAVVQQPGGFVLPPLPTQQYQFTPPPPQEAAESSGGSTVGLNHLALILRLKLDPHFGRVGLGSEIGLEPEVGFGYERWRFNLAGAAGAHIYADARDVWAFGGRTDVLYDVGDWEGLMFGGSFGFSQYVSQTATDGNPGRGSGQRLVGVARYSAKWWTAGVDVGAGRFNIDEDVAIDGILYHVPRMHVTFTGSVFIGGQFRFPGEPDPVR